jgi:hypothetical protein
MIRSTIEKIEELVDSFFIENLEDEVVLNKDYEIKELQDNDGYLITSLSEKTKDYDDCVVVTLDFVDYIVTEQIQNILNDLDSQIDDRYFLKSIYPSSYDDLFEDILNAFNYDKFISDYFEAGILYYFEGSYILDGGKSNF